jgi:hypothetical protein
MPTADTSRPPLRRRPVQLLLALVVPLVLVLVLARWATDGPDPDRTRPGRLLTQEAITSGHPDWARGWRITYTTEDSRGRHVEASAVVVAGPRGLAEHAPVLAVGHGTTGIVADCAPSEFDDDLFPVRPAAPVVQLLRQGWVAVQADYIGLGEKGPDGVHPYLDGRSEAHAVLDATRAARALDDLHLSAKTVLYGTSQGGHAVLFAAGLAPSYAPEIDLLGVAAAAPATDLAGLLEALGATPGGLVIASYLAVSWEAVHPDAHVREQVTDWQLATTIAADCTAEAAATAAQARPGTPILPPDALAGPLRDLLAQNTPTLPIDVPVLVGQGQADPTVSPSVQLRWVAQRCAAGQHLDYRTYPGITHDTIATAASPFVPQVDRWIDDRYRGLPATPTC